MKKRIDITNNIIPDCELQPGRFSMDMLNIPKTTFRCYDFEDQFDRYVAYMEQRLKRRNSNVELRHRPTNTHMNTINITELELSNEWKRVMRRSKDAEYYNFCDVCLKSNLNLFA